MVGMIKPPRDAAQAQESRVGAGAFGEAEQSMPEEEIPPGTEQEGDDDYENDPTYQAAMKFALRGLYEAGASDNINRQLKKKGDKVERVANVTYELVSIADERTGGVEAEVLVPFAMDLLEEVLVIAEASGVQLSDAEKGEVVKIMVLRWAGEQGLDTRDLQAAMDKVTPEDFGKILAGIDEGQADAPEGVA